MPSLRTFIFTAAAAFGTLTSAIPVAQGVSQGTQLVGVDDALNNIIQGVSVKDVNIDVISRSYNPHIPPVGRDGVTQASQVVGVADTLNNVVDKTFAAVLVGRADQPTDVLGNTVGQASEGLTGSSTKLTSGATLPPPPGQNVNGGSTGANLDGTNPSSVVTTLGGLKTRDTPVSLPVALKSATGQLQAVFENLHKQSDGKSTIDVHILVNIIGDVQVIVGGLLDQVKLLVGLSLDIILSLDGKVLAIVDVAALLQTVLALVAAILTCVLKLCASADANVILPLIAGLGPFLCQTLTCIFGLVPGLLNAVVGIVGGVVAALTTLKLDAVVALLKLN
ncbi:hypothetical protein H0H92_005013 [Tricholoma furcatifolium]|nr:hypothetical protein H0H92_005013 [Tricholoma furcatifolium]